MRKHFGELDSGKKISIFLSLSEMNGWPMLGASRSDTLLSVIESMEYKQSTEIPIRSPKKQPHHVGVITKAFIELSLAQCSSAKKT